MSALLASIAAIPAGEAVKLFSSGVTLAIALFVATTKTGKRR
jgi:hypothetical protein